MKAANILQTIGNTPHVRINRLFPSRVEVYMKLERWHHLSFLKSPQYQEFLRTGQCSKDSFVPVITLIINGQTTTLQDNGLILNTGGLDPDICAGQTEFHEWSQIQ